jgi:hypothetical protein
MRLSFPKACHQNKHHIADRRQQQAQIQVALNEVFRTAVESL